MRVLFRWCISSLAVVCLFVCNAWDVYKKGGHQKVKFEQVFADDVQKIIQIYKTTVKNPLLSITEEKNCELNWTAATRAVLALVYMLPPGAKYRNKGTGKNECVEEKLILFKQLNTSLLTIIQQKKTSQPTLVAQGQSKSSITQYNLIIDNNSIPCPRHCSSIKAFEILFMSHYVFHVKYDDSLIHFWQFVQTYYFQLEL